MRPALKKWLVVVSLVLSLGTPWAMLQSVAWFGMLVSYSSQGSFLRAVEMTFDGKHPCKLCNLVQKGQTEERQQNKQLPKHDDSMQLGLPPIAAAFCHPPAISPAAQELITPHTRA